MTSQSENASTHKYKRIVDCTVEYDRLFYQRIQRWAKNQILDVRTLLHQSHGHAVLMLLTTRCLWAARFISRPATRDL